MPTAAEVRVKTRRRIGEEGGLAITSLMDMMTIILVFLLKSYSVEDIQVKPSADLQLPSSTALKNPKVAVNVVVSKRNITVDGVKVVDLTELRVPDDYKKGTLISPLYDVLFDKADTSLFDQAMGGEQQPRRLLLQSDREIPFAVIREVMYTAGQAKYAGIEFVVYKE